MYIKSGTDLHRFFRELVLKAKKTRRARVKMFLNDSKSQNCRLKPKPESRTVSRFSMGELAREGNEPERKCTLLRVAKTLICPSLKSEITQTTLELEYVSAYCR